MLCASNFPDALIEIISIYLPAPTSSIIFHQLCFFYQVFGLDIRERRFPSPSQMKLEIECNRCCVRQFSRLIHWNFISPDPKFRFFVNLYSLMSAWSRRGLFFLLFYIVWMYKRGVSYGVWCVFTVHVFSLLFVRWRWVLIETLSSTLRH